MVSTIDPCKCGVKWQVESHDSEGSYRGHLACGICKRVIVTWEGPYSLLNSEGHWSSLPQTLAVGNYLDISHPD